MAEYRCCHCGTAFPEDHPLCPQCGAAAVVDGSRWDGITSRHRDDVAKLQGLVMRYRDALVDVSQCHNLATVREAARRALA